jgi:hypothetical protein
MDLEKLEDKIINLQNNIIQEHNILDELWRYHPSNENFINPIKEYDKLKKSIEEKEIELDEIQDKINRLNNLN